MYVALIDTGVVKWFDQKIWSDPEKAKAYYLRQGITATIRPVGKAA